MVVGAAFVRWGPVESRRWVSLLVGEMKIVPETLASSGAGLAPPGVVAVSCLVICLSGTRSGYGVVCHAVEPQGPSPELD